MSQTNSANYLEFIPVPRRDLKYEIVDGKVTIIKENTGIFNYIAQKVFKRPKYSYIHLDEMGNFIWPLLDGTNDILAISAFIKEEYGEKAEPLYNRVVQYFKTLESYEFIEFLK